MKIMLLIENEEWQPDGQTGQKLLASLREGNNVIWLFLFTKVKKMLLWCKCTCMLIFFFTLLSTKTSWLKQYVPNHNSKTVKLLSLFYTMIETVGTENWKHFHVWLLVNYSLITKEMEERYLVWLLVDHC